MRACFFTLLCLCVASCGGDPDPVDAGTDAGPRPDAGPDDDAGFDGGPDFDAGFDGGPDFDAGFDGGPDFDAGPPTDAGTFADALGYGTDLAALTPADLSCLGTRTAPSGGSSRTFDLVLNDFFTGDVVGGLEVDFFAGDDVTTDGSCPAGRCVRTTASASGIVTATAGLGDWVGYRVRAGTGMIPAGPQTYAEVAHSHFDSGSAATVDGVVVQQTTLDTIVALLGASRESGAAMATGQVVDCAGNPLANAIVRLFDGPTEIPLGFSPTGPRQAYFNGASFPSARQRSSNVDGLVLGANLPVPASGVLRVEIWGARTPGGGAEMIACEQIVAVADGIAFTSLEPARADGPAGCSM